MVGIPAKTFDEELALQVVVDQDPKVQTFKDTVDFPSIDSFLDFDSVSWLWSNRNIEEFNIEDTDFDFFEDKMEMGQEAVVPVKSESIERKPELCDDISGEVGVSSNSSEPVLCHVMSEEVGVSSIKSESMIEVEPKVFDDMYANGVDELAVKDSERIVSDNSRPVEGETEPVVMSDASVACPSMDLDESGLKKTDEGLACSIEVGLKKVSLGTDDDAKGKTDSAESESETSSSSSSSSASSSCEEEESDEEESDEEESKKEKTVEYHMVMGKVVDLAGELEEGEIENLDEEHGDDELEVVEDDDEDEDDDIGLQKKEPIRSKNELKELPPVPAVDVTLEPHHATLPVGAVLSVMSTQVIVEGTEKHSPLTEGSILWITDKRTPLGLVDEIFGPVKCPYYIVRFNSESEVPEGTIQGTPVSFVADFAQHILNIKELQKKGYDASGDNDEEIPDELEFSDDEKEAEYKRMQKMEKRGMMNDQQPGNRRNKKKKNRDLRRPTSSYSGTENQGSSFLSSNRSDPQIGGLVSTLPPRPQMDDFPPNNAAWRPQSNQQYPYQFPPISNQMGMPNLAPMQIPLMAMQNQNQMMFQPQFNGEQMPMPGGPRGLNFFPGQPSVPWPTFVSQNHFNQPFGMGRGIQQQPLPNDLSFNLFTQGLQMHRPQSPMNPQFQIPPQFQTGPQHQMMHPPLSPMNPQVQMQPQSDIRPHSQIPQSPPNSQFPVQALSQGFSNRQSSERGRGFRGRGRGRGCFGLGRGRGRQQSGRN